MSRGRGSARLATILSAAVIAAVISAVFLIDPPMQRRLRLDRARIDHLTQIEDQLKEYWRRHQAMPQDLTALANEPGFDTPIHDPETGRPYEFERVDADSFRLCAEFLLDTGKLPRRHQSYVAWRGERWSHPAGRFCFTCELPKPDQ